MLLTLLKSTEMFLHGLILNAWIRSIVDHDKLNITEGTRLANEATGNYRP